MAQEAGLLVGIESTVVALEVESGGQAPALRPSADRYASRGLLGEGGMGRVECVWDSDLLREVAIKQLRVELRSNARMLEQFLWEARVSAYLDHPNIVPVHDLGVTKDGYLYFSMKRIRGSSLEGEIARLAQGDNHGRLSLERRLRIFLQICQAVAFAHSRGVLHRDLKPANIMLAAHGEVLVTDWGLALAVPGPAGDALRAHVPETLHKSGSGTPAYMSPEQARSEPLDERSDIFALGIILYELSELEHAFQAPTVGELLDEVAHGRIRPVKHASASLRAVIERATALDQQDRYESVTALMEDVEAVLDGRTPDAEHASMIKQAARYYVSHDPAFDRMRVVDFDMWAGSACIAGAGIGLLLAPYLRHLWWVAFLAACAIAVVPTVRWMRFRKVVRRLQPSPSSSGTPPSPSRS